MFVFNYCVLFMVVVIVYLWSLLFIYGHILLVFIVVVCLGYSRLILLLRFIVYCHGRFIIIIFICSSLWLLICYRGYWFVVAIVYLSL